MFTTLRRIRSWFTRPKVVLEVHHSYEVNRNKDNFRYANTWEQEQMAEASARCNRAATRAADLHRRQMVDRQIRHQIANERDAAKQRLALLLNPRTGSWLAQYNPYEDNR